MMVGCQTAPEVKPNEDVVYEKPVLTEVEKPLPDYLLVRCEKDEPLPKPAITRDYVAQSEARKRKLNDCAAIVDRVIQYNEKLKSMQAARKATNATK